MKTIVKILIYIFWYLIVVLILNVFTYSILEQLYDPDITYKDCIGISFSLMGAYCCARLYGSIKIDID